MKSIACSTTYLLRAVCVAFAVTAASAQTAPTSLFQIDGHAEQSTGYSQCSYAGVTGTVACDFWNELNGSGTATGTGGIGTGSSAGHSKVRTFINGLGATPSFTGGGSKDSNALSQWAYSTTPTPNKDTLNAGYAAAYIAPNSDFVMMFGADRLSPNGDANIGIWFFQQSVAPNGSGGFTGAHVNKDIFVISSFTNGGGTSGISVLEWDSACASGVKNPGPNQCADTNLRLLASAAANNVCGSALYCAVTNSSSTASSWESAIASPLFFQGGVNITRALMNAGVTDLPCFSSFLEETRSSQSTTAVLKDFLSGGLPVCGLHITKTCDQANTKLVNNGTQVQFAWTGTVTNIGVGTLSGVQVNDTLPDSSTAHPALNIGGSTVTSLTANQTANYSITYTGSTVSATNTATAQGAFGSTTINSDNTAQATCSQPVSTSISVVKHCAAPGPGLQCGAGGCVVQVPYYAQVCNNGTVQLTNISLSDSPTSTISGNNLTLNPGQCTGGTGNPAHPSGTYQPTAFDPASDGATNGRFSFTDVISVNSATAAIGPNPTVIPAGQQCAGTLACAPVSCPMCSSGECSGALP